MKTKKPLKKISSFWDPPKYEPVDLTGKTPEELLELIGSTRYTLGLLEDCLANLNRDITKGVNFHRNELTRMEKLLYLNPSDHASTSKTRGTPEI